MGRKATENLDEQLGKVEGNIYLYTLKVALPCQRLLPNGTTCGQETNIAIAVERMDYYLVFPQCPKHLPSWAKAILKGQGKLKERGTVKGDRGHSSKTYRASKA